MKHRTHILAVLLLLTAAATLFCVPLQAQHEPDIIPFGDDSKKELSADELKKIGQKLYEHNQPLGIRYTEKHPLIIGADWMLRPYSFVDDDGQPAGFYVDILENIFRNMHVPYEIRMMDRVKARKALVEGRVHLMIDTHLQGDSLGLLYSSQVVREYQPAVMHLKGADHIRSLSLLDEHDSVYVKSNSYASFYIKHMFADSIPFYMDYCEQLVAQSNILNRKIKYFIWDRFSLLDLTRRYGTRDLVDIDPVDIPVRKFRFVSRDSVLLHELDLQFLHLKEMGRYDIILNSWLAEDVTEDKSYGYVEIIAVVTFIIIVVLVFFVVVLVQRGSSMSGLKEEFRNVSQMAIDLSNCYFLGINLRTMRVENLSGDLIPKEGISYPEYENLIHPDDISVEYEARRQVDEGSIGMPVVQFRMKKHGDTTDNWRIMSVHAYVKTNRNKRPIYIYLVMLDETDRIEKERRLAKTTKEFASITDITDIGMVYFDNDGNYVNSNSFVKRLLDKGGTDRAEDFLVNTTLQELLFSIVGGITKEKDMDMWFCTLLDIPDLNLRTHVEMRIQSVKDGDENRGYAMAITDIEDNIVLARNVSDMAVHLAAIKSEISRLQMELRFILRRSNMSSFRWAVGNDYLEVSRDLFSFDSQVPLTRYFDSIIDDKKFQDEGIVTNPAKYFSTAQHKIRKSKVMKGGRWATRWLSTSFIPEYDSDGRFIGAFGLFYDITDLEDMQEELRRLKSKADDSGRQKTLFLSNMTHELRTPLNAINGFAEIMEYFSPEEKKEYLGIMAHNCTMLISIVDNILEISKMDSDGISINPKEVDFAVVFPAEVRKLSHYITNPDVRFVIDTPMRSLRLNIDMQRIMQIVEALVNNSSKFTQKGFVRVGYRYISGLLTIYCRDSGSGIPKERRDELFDRFVKLNDYVQGIGLGLPLCKLIAEQMGAKIDVYSRVGEGTTISVNIKIDQIK